MSKLEAIFFRQRPYVLRQPLSSSFKGQPATAVFTSALAPKIPDIAMAIFI